MAPTIIVRKEHVLEWKNDLTSFVSSVIGIEEDLNYYAVFIVMGTSIYVVVLMILLMMHGMWNSASS